VPLTGVKSCNLSFSGLKSNITRTIEQLKQESPTKDLTDQMRADIAASFQRVALTHVSERVKIGLQWCTDNLPTKLTSLVVAGGVARNQQLRTMITSVAQQFDVTTYFPPVELCVDNGVMIAWAGIEIWKTGRGKIVTNKEDIQQIVESHKIPLSQNSKDIFNQKFIKSADARRRGAN
jgi:N6-L-threonylcarbamoyladenine synthase